MNTSNIIWGPSGAVNQHVENHGGKAESWSGGYDDYDGTKSWAELDTPIQGECTRFSPHPGVWMSGIRVRRISVDGW